MKRSSQLRECSASFGMTLGIIKWHVVGKLVTLCYSALDKIFRAL